MACCNAFDGLLVLGTDQGELLIYQQLEVIKFLTNLHSVLRFCENRLACIFGLQYSLETLQYSLLTNLDVCRGTRGVWWCSGSFFMLTQIDFHFLVGQSEWHPFEYP